MRFFKEGILEAYEKFTNDQKNAFNIIEKFIIDWHKTQSFEKTLKRNYRSIGGFAGTGKSYLIAQIAKHLKISYQVSTLTGKAAENLQQRDIDAQTIHSTIYKPIIEDDVVVGYEKRDLPPAELIIIDEDSMIEPEHAQDILSFGVPVLFFGDDFQLPPISGERPEPVKERDYIMEEIMRTSGVLVKWLTRMRSFREIPFWGSWKDKDGRYAMSLQKDDDWVEDNLLNFDRIICGRNATKNYLNQEIRQRKNLNSIYPIPGEQIMCLKNKKLKNGVQIRNGEVFTLIKMKMNRTPLDDQKNAMFLLERENKEKIWVTSSLELFEDYEFDYNKAKVSPIEHKRLSFFDFCYAITAHKSQGSQYKKVLVLAYDLDFMDWGERNDFVHAIYTALGRAEEIGAVVFKNKMQIRQLLKKKNTYKSSKLIKEDFNGKRKNIC